MPMNIWKRNAIVAAVALFVCVAVYLNWSMNQAESVDAAYEEFETSMTLQETSGTMTTAAPTASPDSAGASPSVSPSAAPAAQDTYFSEARLSRQEARDSALSLLNDTADQETVNSEELAKEVSAIAQNALREVRIESLVKAKGFTDCVAFIGDDGISVVVSAPATGLNQTDVAKIRDIVQGETNFTAGQIHIVEANEPAA